MDPRSTQLKLDTRKRLWGVNVAGKILATASTECPLVYTNMGADTICPVQSAVSQLPPTSVVLALICSAGKSEGSCSPWVGPEDSVHLMKSVGCPRQ